MFHIIDGTCTATGLFARDNADLNGLGVATNYRSDWVVLQVKDIKSFLSIKRNNYSYTKTNYGILHNEI